MSEMEETHSSQVLPLQLKHLRHSGKQVKGEKKGLGPWD